MSVCGCAVCVAFTRSRPGQAGYAKLAVCYSLSPHRWQEGAQSSLTDPATQSTLRQLLMEGAGEGAEAGAGGDSGADERVGGGDDLGQWDEWVRAGTAAAGGGAGGGAGGADGAAGGAEGGAEGGVEQEGDWQGMLARLLEQVGGVHYLEWSVVGHVGHCMGWAGAGSWVLHQHCCAPYADVIAVGQSCACMILSAGDSVPCSALKCLKELFYWLCTQARLAEQ